MITVTDIAYVRYQAPDLDAMERFLTDFGLQRSARTAQALYMRACGTAQHVHVTELGEKPATLGFGLYAKSEEDLHTLARQLGAPVENTSEPGGGLRVRCTDPAGFTVDVIYAQQQHAPLPYREPLAMNPATGRKRMGCAVRLAPRPSSIVRLGHIALLVPDFRKALDFYRDVLGFRISESYYAGAPENMIAAFMHCGLGDQYTDHHTVALIAAQDGVARFDHTAFEVVDLDDVMQGGEFLKSKNYKHSWGVGRHIQGSQIFDYWRDPFGHKIEHWTDGDLVNDDTPTGHDHISNDILAQWAPPVTPEFFA